MSEMRDLEDRLRIAREGGRAPLVISMSPETWRAIVAEAREDETSQLLVVSGGPALTFDGVEVRHHEGQTGTSFLFEQEQ